MKLKRMAGAAAVLLLLAVCTGALAVDTGIITAEAATSGNPLIRNPTPLERLSWAAK